MATLNMWGKIDFFLPKNTSSNDFFSAGDLPVKPQGFDKTQSFGGKVPQAGCLLKIGPKNSLLYIFYESSTIYFIFTVFRREKQLTKEHSSFSLLVTISPCSQEIAIRKLKP